jgi:hypothetical protein
MRDPHVRFRERHGGVIPRAYSTALRAQRSEGAGGSCGPTWAIRGGTPGEGLASGYLRVMR